MRCYGQTVDAIGTNLLSSQELEEMPCRLSIVKEVLRCCITRNCTFNDFNEMHVEVVNLGWNGRSGCEAKKTAAQCPKTSGCSYVNRVPAATYSPTRSPVQYHRPWRA